MDSAPVSSNTTHFPVSPASVHPFLLNKQLTENERLHTDFVCRGGRRGEGRKSTRRTCNSHAKVTVNHVHVDGGWLSKRGHARVVSGVCKLGTGYVQRALESVHPFGVNADPRLPDRLQACLVRVHRHIAQIPEYGSQVVWALAQLTPHAHLAVLIDVQLWWSENPGPHLCESRRARSINDSGDDYIILRRAWQTIKCVMMVNSYLFAKFKLNYNIVMIKICCYNNSIFGYQKDHSMVIRVRT